MNTNNQKSTNKQASMSDIFSCKCLKMNDTKMAHLKTILTHNNVLLSDFDLEHKIHECDELLQLILSPTKYSKLNNVFCQECDTHVPTKYHAEGLDCHLTATALVAEYVSSMFYEKFITYFDAISLSSDNFTELCKIVGLFHDIGKPFARNQISEKKKHPIYVGHAQLGTRLINQVDPDHYLIKRYKHSIEWAINHHMCSCTHMHSIDVLENIGIQMMLDLGHGDLNVLSENKTVAFALLSVVSYADHLSRLADDLNDRKTSDVLNHSFSLFEKLCQVNLDNELFNKLPDFSGKLIILNYGFSGSGKSHFSNIVKEKFSDEYDIVHIERDQSLYSVYEKYFGSTVDKTYEQIYSAMYTETTTTESSTSTSTSSTSTTSNNSRPNKTHVQEQWIQDLADGLDTKQTKNGQIIIIDSVQTLFPSQWLLTLNAIRLKSEEAYDAYVNSPKIGYYGIPIHMFNSEIVSKTGKHFMLPDPNVSGMFFPTLLTENESKASDATILSYGSGSVDLLLNYIGSYFQLQNKRLSDIITIDIDAQQNLVHLLNQIVQSFQAKGQLINVGEVFFRFLNNFLDKSGGHLRFISYKIEIENKDYQLITFTYDDGLQTFNGTTRDYRGEAVIYNKLDCTFHYIRPSLPVFPEMSSIQKDQKAFPYLLNIWDELENFSNSTYKQIKSKIKPKTMTGLYMVPKYDGSLFNLTFVNKSNTVYPMIQSLIDNNMISTNCKILSSSFYYVEQGVFLIGSKGTVLSKNPVNERIHNAIKGSYESVEEFLLIAQQYVNDPLLFNSNNQIITLHFEAIDAIPSPELTVYYGKAWCPFFGITTYDQVTDIKKFTLPIDQHKGAWSCVADIYNCEANWKNIQQLYKDNYEKLLNGDQIVEPEGYVIHIFNEDLNEWIPIKYKYKIYYTAHKPESKHNLAMALELSSNPQYKLLCQRLSKFREKQSIEQILQLAQTDISNIRDVIILSNIQLSEPRQTPDTLVYVIVKKDWALYWRNKKNISQFFQPMENIKVLLVEHYDQLKDLNIEKFMFNFLMKIYESFNLSLDSKKLTDLNNDQLILLLKEILY